MRLTLYTASTLAVALILMSCRGATTRIQPLDVNWNLAEADVRLVYRAFALGEDLPELRSVKINDSLTYVQLWPGVKFPLVREGNELLLPVALLDRRAGIPNLGDLAWWPKVADTSFNWMYNEKRRRYEVPVDRIPRMLRQMDIDSDSVKWALIIRTTPGMVLEAREDSLGGIELFLATGHQYSNYNNEVRFDTARSGDTLQVATSIYHPEISLQAFGPATGRISFESPAETFHLAFGRFGNDRKFTASESFTVDTRGDSVRVIPGPGVHDVVDWEHSLYELRR